MAQAWTDDTLRTTLRAKGLERAGEFSWARAARQALAGRVRFREWQDLGV